MTYFPLLCIPPLVILHLATLVHVGVLLVRGTGLDSFWRIVYVLGLVVYPTVMFVLYVVFGESVTWKGAATYGWISLLDQRSAGYITLPIWVLADIFLLYGIVYDKLQYKTIFAAIITLGLICGWTFGNFLFVRHTLVPQVFALVPALVLLALTMLALHIARRSLGGSSLMALPWMAGLAATFVAKIVLAQHEYSRLRDTPPGGCFIVTAAARGHRRLVGSWRGVGGVVENMQLRRMRAMEAVLMDRWPRFHRCLRAVYNRLGPLVARRIRWPYLADAIYLLLKPVELAALGVVIFLSRRPAWTKGVL